MRFFHDGSAIVRDTIPPLPSRSLSAAIDGSKILVTAANGYILAALHYSEIQRQDGTGFGSATAAKSYLDGVFNSFAGIPTHSHVIADVTGLQAALDGKAASSHTHTIAQVTGLQSALDGKQAAGSYAAASHTHVIADVTGLQAALDGKAPLSHTHTIPQITGLQTALDAKLTATIAPAVTTRALNTTFQPSATKMVRVAYSVKVQVTNPLLVGTSTCTVTLLSDAANPPTTERGRVEATSGVGITVTIALTTSNTAMLTYIVPAGHYVRLVSNVVGTGAASIVSQVEETLG